MNAAPGEASGPAGEAAGTGAALKGAHPSPTGRAAATTVIPCSDEFRHPDGSVVTIRLLPHLFFGPQGGSMYPRSSPLRCHACRLPFSSPPVFIPTSIQYHPPTVPGRMTIELTGHYCSAGCRNRALDEMDGVLAETYRMFAVRADLECFGKATDYATACPAVRDLAPFGGSVSLEAFERARSQTALTAAMLEAIPPGVVWVYRLRGVRETWYGKLEGGDGRREILRALAEEAPARAAKPPETGPDPGPLAAPSWDAPARLWDEAAAEDGETELEAYLHGQPGSPRFVVDGGVPLRVWPAARGALCEWCAGPVHPRQPVLVPKHRDLLNSIHLEGNFCSPGCGFAWLSSERRGLSPTRHYERIGLFVWMCGTVLGVPLRSRPRTAPHYLELDEFGGDLSRAEFNAQERREDLFTSLEAAPAISRRMLGNYTRPGVVCDLTRLGAQPSVAAAPRDAAAGAAQQPSLPGMFEELIRDCPPTAPPQPAPKRKGMLITADRG
jgi:hypothetical protein